MGQRTDDELVRAARGGDKSAFGELVDRYAALVRQIARRTVGHPDIAHDLSQEAFLRAYLALDTLRTGARFRSWLYGITLNVCREYLRQQRTNVYSLEALLGGVYRDAGVYGPTPEDIVERLELRRLVWEAIGQLSEGNRMAVVLYYYDGFDQREIADILAISVAAVKGRLFKARKALHVRLLSVVQPSLIRPGERTMIPVEVVDVTQQRETSDSGDVYGRSQVVLLDAATRRALVIWVGEMEGLMIALGITNYATPRPVTPAFMARLLQAAGATVAAVEISALVGNTYHATVRIASGDSQREVDARPSDALALALQVNAPVYVDEAVMAQVSVIVPEGLTATGKGVRAIIEQLEAGLKAPPLEGEEVAKPATPCASEVEANTRAVLAKVFE